MHREVDSRWEIYLFDPTSTSGVAPCLRSSARTDLDLAGAAEMWRGEMPCGRVRGEGGWRVEGVVATD